MASIQLPPTCDSVWQYGLARVLGISTQAGREALSYALRDVLLLDRKQQDYGPRNISDFGVTGVLIRINDKVSRLKNLHGKGRRRKAQNESVRDSYQDLTNYGIIARMLLDGKWPGDTNEAQNASTGS